MFRFRLYAQSFTIVAMLGGSLYYNADRLKRNEYVKLKKKREAQEKKEAWIRELEARDEEDKEWRSKVGKVRDAQREEVDTRLLEEKRRLDREEAERKGKETNDDRRGLIETIRLQANAIKAKEEKMQQIEASTRVGTLPVAPPPTSDQERAAGTLPVGPPPMSDQERAAAQPKSTSLLGESEQGGLLGIGHLKTFWKSRRPKQPEDDENSR